MKGLQLTLFLALSLFVGQQLFAQATTACNNKTAPEVQTGTNSYEVGGTIWTPAPPLSVQAVGFANVEYLIVKKGTCALDSARTACDTTNGGGDVIIGADADGILDPATLGRYGVTVAPGDTFGMVAIGYDMGQVRVLLDSILNGIIAGSGSPCCGLFNLYSETRGFCDTLSNLGITSINDVNTLADVLTVFDAFTDAQLSAASLVSYMDLVNGFSSRVNGFECGDLTDNLLICYGLNPSQVHYYRTASTVATTHIDGLNAFSVFPNPAAGDVQLFLDLKEEQDLQVNIYNSLGQRLHSQNLGAQMGQQQFQLPTAQFSAGIYLIEINNGSASSTQKVILR
ncbi:T9SS type A sorting domain-containing protein [Saprospira sp. CCB-QB6]|uniref:T9SS type A sorting domain-containing protein n=1 Tax=Saprospira sp. CCB-QB6 TaxID=3023936 RepID=UPI00234AB7CC|nr:T9SS type A sorting domain-containing protein [Saprospira sp. CCB-QB6]WCL80129.1 T9SS type A sorting domain-containing protein [Saprospira sp. CCB-QB6]